MKTQLQKPAAGKARYSAEYKREAGNPMLPGARTPFVLLNPQWTPGFPFPT